MITAVIFDMDGVIIDSEQLHSFTYGEILRRYGVEPIIQEATGTVQTPGLRGHDAWEELKKKHHLSEDTDVLKEKKWALYKSVLAEQDITPMSGLVTLLQVLKQKKVRLAVASGSPRDHIELILKKFGIDTYFSVIVSGTEVTNGKPDPEIFLTTAAKLEVPAEECLVIEDSQAGVTAAKKAGMQAIAVPNKYTKYHDFSLADAVLSSLQEFPMHLLL